MKLLLVLMAFSALAQTSRTHGTRVWFRDGTCVEVHTEATGNAPLFASGTLNVDSSDTVQRLVLDEHDRVLFGYDVEARKGTAAGAYSIRIRPMDTQHYLPAGVFVAAGNRVPTLAGSRDFPAVKSGEAVMVDILYNPTTGEKIYDVLRPLAATEDEFAFDGVRVLVNGKLLDGTAASSTPGRAVLLHLPERGDYFVALDPPANGQFTQAARVEREKLVIGENGDTIEVVSKANILKTAGSRKLWMYHNRKWRDPNDLAAELSREVTVARLQQQIETLSKTYRPDYPPLRQLTMELQRLNSGHKDTPFLETTDDLEDLMQRRSRK